ncbi:MAG: class II glutamine amidotransferase [Thiotrichales bacterium]
MSRFAAYLGPPIALANFLVTPTQSLIQQASHHSEGRTTPEVEGYGFGWFTGIHPMRYSQPVPIWTDTNLVALAASLQRGLWFGFLGGGHSELDYGATSAQPLHDELMLFAHDGFVADFAHTLRPYCLRYLQPEFAAQVDENTDSAYLFALLRQRLREFDEISIEGALQNILSTLQVTLMEVPSQLNLLVSDGRRLVATRYATRNQSTPVYYTVNDPTFPANAQLVASHPLTTGSNWRQLPPNHMLILSSDAPPSVLHI